jgi:hypothetical protein
VSTFVEEIISIFLPFSIISAIGFYTRALLCWDMIFLFPISSGLYLKCMLKFFKGFFYIYWDEMILWLLSWILFMCYVMFLNYAYVEPSLHPWNDTNLIIKYQCVVEFDLQVFYCGLMYQCSSWILVYSIFIFIVYFSGFGIRIIMAFIEWVWQYSFLLYFMESFSVTSSIKFLSNSTVNLSGFGIFFAKRHFIIAVILLLIIDLFRLFISSQFYFYGAYTASSLSISSRFFKL